MVGHHPVVHVHGKQRKRQRKEVDQQRGPQHIAVHKALRQHRTPEPVAFASGADDRGALVKAEVGAGKQHHTGVAAGQFLGRQLDAALPRLAPQRVDAAIGLSAEHHAGLLALHDQDGRQGQRIDLVDAQALDTGGQAGLGSGPLGQAQGQPAFRAGQSCGQRGARGTQPMQSTDLDQAIQQGVWRDEVFPQPRGGLGRRGCRQWRDIQRWPILIRWGGAVVHEPACGSTCGPMTRCQLISAK